MIRQNNAKPSEKLYPCLENILTFRYNSIIINVKIKIYAKRGITMRNRPKMKYPAIMEDNPNSINLLHTEPYDLQERIITALHFHREFELGICISGRGILFYDGEEHEFEAGDLQIIYPYVPHMNYALGNEPCHWIWLFINYENLCNSMGIVNFATLRKYIRTSSCLSGLVNPESAPLLHQRLSDFVIKHGKEGFSDEEHMAYDFYGIILAAYDAVSDRAQGSSKILSKTDMIEPALQRISDDLSSGESSSVEALSKCCSMSVTNFRRVFTEMIGASPKVYIQTCRLQRAKQLLCHSKMNILDIALSVGYKDISGFNRSFSELAGETPSEYRRRHWGTNIKFIN